MLSQRHPSFLLAAAAALTSLGAPAATMGQESPIPTTPASNSGEFSGLIPRIVQCSDHCLEGPGSACGASGGSYRMYDQSNSPFCEPESSGLFPHLCAKRKAARLERWHTDAARPYGDAVRSINQAQVSKGDAAQMVLYDFDFQDGEALLNLSGLRRLDRIVRMLPCNFYPIIIQGVDHNPHLAEARRQEVLNVLHSTREFFPVPDERVVIADPRSPGLDGLDAEIVHQKLLGLTFSGVGPMSTGFETADVPVIAPVVINPQP